jgi:hypothetical protein
MDTILARLGNNPFKELDVSPRLSGLSGINPLR